MSYLCVYVYMCMCKFHDAPPRLAKGAPYTYMCVYLDTWICVYSMTCLCVCVNAHMFI